MSTQELTLSEALEALRYLWDRGTLCQKCGYKWAELSNQWHNHCVDCSIKTQNYSPHKRGSDFERLLCKRLNEWVHNFVSTGT